MWVVAGQTPSSPGEEAGFTTFLLTPGETEAQPGAAKLGSRGLVAGPGGAGL